MSGAFRVAQARVGLLARCIDLASLADIGRWRVSRIGSGGLLCGGMRGSAVSGRWEERRDSSMSGASSMA
jgi:hypothetical protein